jgi:hypothetical protein
MLLCFFRYNKFVLLENDFPNAVETFYSPVVLSELCVVFHTHIHWLKRFLSAIRAYVVGSDLWVSRWWQSPRGGKMNILIDKHYFKRSKNFKLFRQLKGNSLLYIMVQLMHLLVLKP